MFVMEENRYLTVKQVAAQLQIHPETVRELLRKGAIPGAKVAMRRNGGATLWRVSQAELDAHIQKGDGNIEEEQQQNLQENHEGC